MSRIWALPLPEPLDQWHPLGACWWRHPLDRNDDGHHLIIQTDQLHDDAPARLACWEFFDGADAQLIHGVHVFGERFCTDGARSHIDVLAIDVPTLSPKWRNLTEPGVAQYRHDPHVCAWPADVGLDYGFPVSLKPSGHIAPA